MAVAESLAGLEPKRVMEVFSELCEIPHGSGNEKAISDYIRAFSEKLGLPCFQDEANNLIIQKPATPGYENAPTVVLQAHMDMVCEKNADVEHDFMKDPIHVLRDGDRIYADGTTLGADDATGVAFAMCVLESKDLPHPALEVVLTTDEERGMTGIKALHFDRIKGRVIVNLDCSDEGIVVGCAGAALAVLRLREEQEAPAQTERCFRVMIRGLKGGHSGLDITKERGNANVLLTRFLCAAEEQLSARLVTISGGMQNNAIAREAEALVLCEAGKETAFRALLDTWNGILQKELRASDPGVKLLLSEEALPEQSFTKEGTQKILDLLQAIDSGVVTMNVEVGGVAETSGNVGTIETCGDTVTARIFYRSGFDSKKRYVLDKTRRLARLAGAEFEVGSDSYEWEYKPENRLSALIQRVYRERYGTEIKVEVSHGGNECGTFFKHFPDADIVCTGTQIVGAHTPQESVRVSIIQKEWEMLCLTLKGMLSY